MAAWKAGVVFEKLREQQPEMAGEIDALLNSAYMAGGIPYYMPPPRPPAESQITDGGHVPWQRRGWRRYGLDGDVEAGSTMYRERPIRPATKENNVIVPVLQATIDAVLFGFAIIALGIAAMCMGLLQISALPLLGIGLAAFAVIWPLSWRNEKNKKERLCWLTEEIVGQDLNGDGTVGQPEQSKPEKQTILVRTHAGNDLIFSALLDGTEVEQDKLMAFVADGFKFGYTLERARMCGLERPEWDSIVDTMEKMNLVMPKSQGIDARARIGREAILDAMRQL